MSRIRNIKPEFFKNEDLAVRPAYERLAFIGLWTQADWTGRLLDRPTRLRIEIFPYEPKVDMPAILASLAAAGFIRRYTVDGVACIEIVNFSKHQAISGKERERPSEIPAPNPETFQSSSSLVPEQDQSSSRIADIGHRTKDEGQGTEDNSCTEPVPGTVPPSAPAEVFVKGRGPYQIDEAEVGMWFPVVGCKDPRGWPLTKSHAKQLRASFKAKFPNGDDMRLEFEKARSWAINNPRKRKTPDGMPSFLNHWIGKSR